MVESTAHIIGSTVILAIFGACILPQISGSFSTISDKYKTTSFNFQGNPNLIETWRKHDEDLIVYLNSLVPQGVTHTGSLSFDQHLRGVQAVLRNWGADEAVADAGLFHSVYGTEAFQGHQAPVSLRPVLRSFIGERSERLVWIFCMVDRNSVDETVRVACGFPGDCNDAELPRENFNFSVDGFDVSFRAREELGRFRIPLRDENEWLDFLQLTLADWLEQVEGAAVKAVPAMGWSAGEAWGYRREAYAMMTKLLVDRRNLHVAERMHADVYAQESVHTRGIHQIRTNPVSDAAKKAKEALASRFL